MRSRWIWAVALAALFGATSCYNTSRVKIPLSGNPAGAECHSRCLSKHDGDTPGVLACMSECPGAERAGDACSTEDLPPEAICEHQRVLSKWKTYGLVIGGVVGMLMLGGGGGS